MKNYLKNNKNKIFKTLGIVFVIDFILACFLFYNFGFKPIEMPKYTLSNGHQTIVFQTMIHIGKPEYYQQVAEDVKTFKNDGYKYLYEFVKFNNKEDIKKFIELTNIDSSIQLDIGNAFGLAHQKDFLTHIDSDDINADLSGHHVNLLIENNEKYSGKPWFSNDTLNEYREKLMDISNMSENKKYFMLSMFRIGMNSIMTFPFLIDTPSPVFDEVIVNARNNELFKIVKSDTESNFIINYGFLHFDGFYKMLKNHDPKWKIEKVEHLKAF